MGDARLQVKVSADAKEASAAFASLAKDIKAVGTESVGVTDGVTKVAAALAKLEKAPDTPMALARATAKLKVEMDELRATLDKTPASADKMKAISAALAQADAAMQKSIVRAGKLGEAQEEVKQKMGLTAKGAESLGNSFGSLDGIMGKMADSSSGVSQGIAKLGFSVMAAGAALKFGYDMGEKLRAGLTALGVALPDYSDQWAGVVTNIERAVRGYKDAELVENDAVKRAREIIAAKGAQARAIQDARVASEKAGVGLKLESEAVQDLTVKSTALALAMTRLKNAGQDWDSLVRANATSIKALVEAEIALGTPLEQMAPWLRMAAQGLSEFSVAGQTASAASTKLAMSTSDFHQQATKAFMGGELQSWASKHAAAIASVVDANIKAGMSVKDMSSVEQAAYKIATVALAEMEAAAKKVPDALLRIVPAIDAGKIGFEGLRSVVERMATANGLSLSSLEKLITAEMDRAKGAGDSTEAYQKLLDAINALQAKGVETVADIDKETEARRKLNEEMAKSIAVGDAEFAAKKKRWAEEDARGTKGDFSAPVDPGFKKIRYDAVGAAAAAGEFGTSLDTVAKKVVSLNGTLTVQEQIWLSVAMASDKATDALYRQIEATRQLSDAQIASLEAARGWSDYIIALKDGYESGVTSLGSYIQQLVAFKSQLEQMFAGVSGAAADSLNEMIQLIETLLATAGANGPASRGGGYKGDFQRNADKGA